jgi:hypothetical protein
MNLLGSLLGQKQQPAAPQPAAGPPAGDPSQSMNPLTRMKAKAQGDQFSKKVSDVDLGDMGQPVRTAPMQMG